VIIICGVSMSGDSSAVKKLGTAFVIFTILSLSLLSYVLESMILIGVILIIGLPLIIILDCRRKNMNPFFWLSIIYITGLIGLVFYAYSREKT